MNFIRDPKCTAVLLILALAGCSEQAAKPPQTEVPSVAATLPKPTDIDRPRLWTDGPAAEMIKAMVGYDPGDTVSVVRWENGDVEGWVDLDQGEGTKRTPLATPGASTGEPSKQAPGTKKTSGWIVVALQRQPDKDPIEYRCRVVGEVTFFKEHESNVVVATRYRFATAEGPLVLQPPEVSAGMAEFTPDSFTMPRVIGGKSAEFGPGGGGKNWLEVRLKKSSSLP